MQISLRNDARGLETSMNVRWHDQLPLLSYQLFDAHPNVVNVVSTRHGGVSTDPYTSLNLALSTQDDQEAVLENRRRLCKAVGIELEKLTIGQLIQGLNIAVITEELRGRGALDRAAALQGTDGLVTDVPDAPLAVLVADCTVVSFFDPVRRVVALAHAGWRGAAGKIAANMVSVMQETFGSAPHDILVGVGPNLGKDHMQVRDDVFQIYQASFGEQARSFFTTQPDGSFLLNLNAALLMQLEESGIREANIEVAGLSTARTDIFYSHRLEKGKTGRSAGLIVLRS
jgi:YfiH family protein